MSAGIIFIWNDLNYRLNGVAYVSIDYSPSQAAYVSECALKTDRLPQPASLERSPLKGSSTVISRHFLPT